MTIGYFATAGHTEAGGLGEFLRKVDDDVGWVRCFPAVDKPAPKLGRVFPTPRGEVQGVTGAALLDRVVDPFVQHGIEHDAYVVIDDGDCRWCADGVAGPERVLDQVRARIRERCGAAPNLHLLMMEPEVEGWLVADWERGIGAWFRSEDEHRGRRVVRALLGQRWELVEEHGCPQRPGGGCTSKLSAQLVDALKQEGLGRYSKARDGALLLKAVEPDVIGRRQGPRYRAALQGLKDLARQAGAGPERPSRPTTRG